MYRDVFQPETAALFRATIWFERNPDIVALFVWRKRLTYIGIAVIPHCVDNKDLETQFCAKHIKNRIDLLRLTVQSLL